MHHRLAAIATTVAALACFALPARAEKLDMMTVTCAQLNESLEKGSENDKSGMGHILYWVAGYSGPEEQSTVVDFKALAKDFDSILKDCKEQPMVGIMSISEKHMGDKATPRGKEAMDIATVTCKAVIEDDDSDNEDGLGLILMWLAGYHAAQNEDTVFDTEAFVEQSKEIGTYCAENPETSFFTASEQAMVGDDDGTSNDDSK